ncbi:hypothetical protein [Clostridium sp. Marseille-P299]|uniref:hypothetical protein n=1 Tax=Clostridium sp. Marseille-P299 TaxID=1805477 RepID=UPI00082FDAAC|nr:hypothetical protein [Clostridium sp. Marseille-P299]
MNNFKFSDLTYERPNFLEVQKKIDDFTNRVKEACAYIDVKNVILENDNLTSEYLLSYGIAIIRNYQDCTNEFYASEVKK